MKNLILFICISCAIAISCNKTHNSPQTTSHDKATVQDKLDADEIPQSQFKFPHYDISLYLNPQKAFIRVSGKIKLPNDYNISDTDFFYLDKSLKTELFETTDGIKFIKSGEPSDNRFIPLAAKYYPENEVKGGSIIQFKYEGTLSDLPPYFANISNVKWAEIGMYYPWFPYNPELKLFTHHIQTSVPDGYEIFGLGNSNKVGENWVLQSTKPTNDIVVCAAKEIMQEQWKVGKTDITLYFKDLDYNIKSKLKNDITSILSNLSSWYNENSDHLSIVLSDRKGGGGYGRIGGIFMGGFNPDFYLEKNEAYYRYFGHELAHMWWHLASTDTWEDWINEGFAEYTGLMILRENFGVEEFQKYIDKKQAEIKGVTPIWGFERNATDPNGTKNVELILYSKAPLLLYQLEKKIGKEPYLNLCKEALIQNVDSTYKLLELITKLEGTETSKWFENQLKTY